MDRRPHAVADAYLTRPDDDPHPGVLFFVDAIGLRPQIEVSVGGAAEHGWTSAGPP